MRIEKRIGAVLTASALAFGLLATPLESVPLSLGAAVSAQEQFAALTLPNISYSAYSLPDSSELEEAYINKLFYGGGVSFYKDYGYTLDGDKRELYDSLRSQIEAVAKGDTDSTIFTVSRSGSFPADSTSDERQEKITEVNTAFNNDFSEVFQYLLVDLPEDFYWFDKLTGATPYGKGNVTVSGNTFTMTFQYKFTVSANYKGADDATVNSSKITAAQTAALKAQAIAASHAGETDEEKILAFRDEICALTEYNFDALAVGTPYGDPWQLVNVFDDNPSTNVVCEGYSKAFQYLCDLSGIECYTVTGETKAGNGAGPHMWNIVVLDGKSYLVDITNSDSGSIGQKGELLLKGAGTSDGTGCIFTSTNPDMSYTYDAETLALYDSAGILTVSTKDYEPTAHNHVWADEWSSDETGHWHACTDTTCKVKNDFAAHTPGDKATEENPQLCTVCDYEIAPKLDHKHTWSTEWKGDKTGHWKVCTKCDTGKSDVEDHNMESVANSAEEATCTKNGKEADKVCSDCGYTENGAVITATGHEEGDPIQENVKDASCTVAGSYDEVVYCKKCNGELSRNPVTGKTLPHDMAEIEGTAKAPTCVADGKEADMKCKNCTHTEEGKVLDATGKHTMVAVPESAEEATCGKPGKAADKKCSVCGLEETGAEIPATGNHTEGEPKSINGVPATCTEEGSYDEVIECTVCGKELSKEHKTIEKIPHTPGTPAKENEAPATCTKNGSYDMVTKCTVCEEVQETEHTDVPALGHDFGSLVQGEATHYQECSRCQTKVGEAAHTKDSGTVTTAPAEENDGVRTYSCTVCEKVLDTETIPALGENHVHDCTIKNSDASNHWNECVCGTKDDTSVEAHNTDTKEEIALEAVCNVDGLKYVITFCADCDREISRVPTVIPKTGIHNESEDYGKDSTDHWNTCTVCGTVVNKEPHTAGPAATETTPQTCTVCGYEMAPVIAHNHTFASAWTSDDNFHWHAATCQHTGEISGMSVHVWDGGVITTQPTETSKGVKTFTCTVCAATKTEPVSEIAHIHTPSDAWRFDVTGHWHVCGSCDEKLNFAAHNEVSEVTVAPTATIPGTRRYYCSVCRYVIREEAIPATGVVDPAYPPYPAGSTIVFPPTANTKDPILDDGSGKSGWKSIADDIRNASSGDAVYVNMNGTTTLSKTALKELMGKNVDLVLEMGEITWTINGETVTKASDVNMKAKLNTNNIPNKIIKALSENGEVVQVSLSHSGSFGFDAVMTVYLGTRYNGKYANLMYYNSKSGAAEYIDCSLIIDGKAALDFTHASEYAIVISDEPMGEYEDVSAAAEDFENGVSTSPAVYVSVLAVIAAAMVIFRKKAVK